jgi:hypothetical protein
MQIGADLEVESELEHQNLTWNVPRAPTPGRILLNVCNLSSQNQKSRLERILSRVFLGPHASGVHVVAFGLLLHAGSVRSQESGRRLRVSTVKSLVAAMLRRVNPLNPRKSVYYCLSSRLRIRRLVEADHCELDAIGLKCL